MTKTINALLLALLSVSGSAWAEWVKINENDSRLIYIDPQTIRKDGNLRKVWQITDLKQRFTNGELSRRSRLEFDCKNERFRYLSFSIHSGPMAGGTILSQLVEDTKWADIPPRSSSETMLQVVCAK